MNYLHMAQMDMNKDKDKTKPLTLKENKIIELLLSTKRQGMEHLIKHMQEQGFFTAPGSTKFHGAYKGGLMEHSWNLMCLLQGRKIGLKIPENELPWESVIIVSITHDLCKMQLYLGDKKPYTSDKEIQNQGHAKRSLMILKAYIELTPLEENMIKYHMGIYGTTEFARLRYGTGEYTLNEWLKAIEDRVVKLFHWCDDTACQFVDKNEPEVTEAVNIEDL